jgi:hypothetical protein
MAIYAITTVVNFGDALDFEGAELQLNKELQEQLINAINSISFGSVVFDSVVNINAIKLLSNKGE